MMKTRIPGLIVVALLMGPAASGAAEITGFSRTTNDGVFTLTAAQAAYLGTPTADRIAFFRVRDGGTPAVSWTAGDFFDADAVYNTVTSNAGAILGLFNGLGDGQLNYASGGLYAPFTSATFLSSNATDGSLYRAIAFTFNSSAGNIVFKNSATFNGGQTLGISDVPVPLPAAAWLLLSGIAGLGMLGRRRKAN